MKKNVIILLLLAPVLAFAQIKGENSKEPFMSSTNKEYKVDDVIILKNPSNSDKYAFVYKFKSNLSFGNIMKTVKNVNDVKNLNTSNVKSIKKAVQTTKNVANRNLAKGSITSLQNKVVSDNYIKENAWDKKYAGKEYKIKSFKVYIDEETGQQIVHAIAKGKGGKIAILIDAAEEKKEI